MSEEKQMWLLSYTFGDRQMAGLKGKLNLKTPGKLILIAYPSAPLMLVHMKNFINAGPNTLITSTNL